MRSLSITILFLHFIFCTNAQSFGNYERKWVIQNKVAYGIKCFKQIGQLTSLNVENGLDSSSLRPLPLGRKVQTNTNPIIFDVYNGILYGINNTEFAGNEVMLSFKKLNISELKRWEDLDSFKQLMIEAAHNNSFVKPKPMQYVLKNIDMGRILFNDISVVNEKNIREVVYAHNLIMNWKYDGHKWKMTDSMRTTIENFYTCFNLKSKHYLIMNNGDIYSLDNKMQKVATTGVDLKKYLLIVDKDSGKLYRISFAEMGAINTSIKSLIDNGNALLVFDPQ